MIGKLYFQGIPPSFGANGIICGLCPKVKERAEKYCAGKFLGTADCNLISYKRNQREKKPLFPSFPVRPFSAGGAGDLAVDIAQFFTKSLKPDCKSYAGQEQDHGAQNDANNDQTIIHIGDTSFQLFSYYNIYHWKMTIEMGLPKRRKVPYDRGAIYSKSTKILQNDKLKVKMDNLYYYVQ